MPRATIEQDLVEAFKPARVKDSTNIEEAALNSHFIRLSADLAYYNQIYSDVLDLLRSCERGLEFGEADIRTEYRAGTQPNGRPASEGYIDDCVKSDHRYKKMREECDHAEVLKSRVAGIVDAIRAKKDMLVTLAANQRAELEGDPAVRRRERSLEDKERIAGYR
jgi:hypothetical protein